LEEAKVRSALAQVLEPETKMSPLSPVVKVLEADEKPFLPLNGFEGASPSPNLVEVKDGEAQGQFREGLPMSIVCGRSGNHLADQSSEDRTSSMPGFTTTITIEPTRA
jgi:hypothetical protein